MNEGELYKLPEVPFEEVGLEEFELVYDALNRQREPRYWTIAGMEAHTGVEPAKIASIFREPNFARRTIFEKDGQAVFASRYYPKQRREKIKEALLAFAQIRRPDIH